MFHVLFSGYMYRTEYLLYRMVRTSHSPIGTPATVVVCTAVNWLPLSDPRLSFAWNFGVRKERAKSNHGTVGSQLITFMIRCQSIFTTIGIPPITPNSATGRRHNHSPPAKRCCLRLPVKSAVMILKISKHGPGSLPIYFYGRWSGREEYIFLSC